MKNQRPPTFGGVQRHVRNQLNARMDPNPFSGLGGQLNKGGGKKTYKDPGPTAGTSPTESGGDMGSQQFGVYAPDINPDQFMKENFTSKGLKGVKRLDEFGGMGGLMSMGGMSGGMSPFGGIGGYGGFGGGFGGGGIVELLMGLMGQMEEDGPIRGR